MSHQTHYIILFPEFSYNHVFRTHLLRRDHGPGAMWMMMVKGIMLNKALAVRNSLYSG